MKDVVDQNQVGIDKLVRMQTLGAEMPDEIKALDKEGQRQWLDHARVSIISGMKRNKEQKAAEAHEQRLAKMTPQHLACLERLCQGVYANCTNKILQDEAKTEAAQLVKKRKDAEKAEREAAKALVLEQKKVDSDLAQATLEFFWKLSLWPCR